MKTISLGEVLQDSWERFTKNIGFVYYLFIPGMLLSFLAEFFLFPQAFWEDRAVPGFVAFYFAAIIVGIILSLLATVSLLFFLSTGKRDKWIDWAEYLRLLPRYVGVSLLQGLIILVGLLFFILPGIYLAIRYAFVTFRALENPSMKIEELFSSEAETTKGNRWTILGITLIAVLVTMILGAIVGMFFPDFYTEAKNPIGDALFQLLVTPFFTLVGIVTYLHLTGRGKAVSPEERSSVDTGEAITLPAA